MYIGTVGFGDRNGIPNPTPSLRSKDLRNF